MGNELRVREEVLQMPTSGRSKVILSIDELALLRRIEKSHLYSSAQNMRAKFILMSADGKTVSQIAENTGENNRKIQRCIKKSRVHGAIKAVSDLPRSGRPRKISDDAQKWLRNMFECDPRRFGVKADRWTLDSVCQYARVHGARQGYSCLNMLTRATLFRILLGVR